MKNSTNREKKALPPVSITASKKYQTWKRAEQDMLPYWPDSQIEEEISALSVMTEMSWQEAILYYLFGERNKPKTSDASYKPTS